MSPVSALSILETLYPALLDAARYAHFIQDRIQAQDSKEGATNAFAAALSDADLSIQTQIELVLLSQFPQIPFFGEEYKASHNTKYFRGTWFLEGEPLLVTLDPIDGTRPYLDGHRLYQIILGIVSRDAFEGAIALFPALGDYVYALRGKGAFKANFGTPLTQAQKWQSGGTPQEVYISSEFSAQKDKLSKSFKRVWSSSEYDREAEGLYVSAVIRRQLCGSAISYSQIIDGAALAFIAQEMGFLVSTLDGKQMPRPEDFPDLVLPGTVVGETEAILKTLRDAMQPS